MNWEEGQRVECEGLDWGPCYVTMSNPQMVIVYCPRYELVTTASPTKLEQAGWKAIEPNVPYPAHQPTETHKVVSLNAWKKSSRCNHHPITRV
jgi:hypothetical protein